jgi:hypothetical protein
MEPFLTIDDGWFICAQMPSGSSEIEMEPLDRATNQDELTSPVYQGLNGYRSLGSSHWRSRNRSWGYKTGS